MRLVATLAFALSVLGCDSGPTSTCAEVCDQEARCADEAEKKTDKPVRFDSGECAAACKALERDDEGRALVKQHTECVAAAQGACDRLMACQ